MRKLFFSVVAATVFFVACNNAESNKVKEETVTVEDNGNTETITETETTSDAPKFSTPEVQKLADDYAQFVKESIAIVKTGDAAKIQEFATKQQEWATKTAEAAAKFTAEDAKLWAEYSQKLATEMAGAAAH